MMTIAMAWKASDPSHHLNGDIKVAVDLKHLHELNNDNLHLDDQAVNDKNQRQ